MLTLESPLVAVLNRLLGAEGWARERLVPFAGETVELRAPPLPSLRFTILEDGTVSSGGQPSLRLTIKPDSLPALLRGEEQFMRSVDIDGNERLAQEVLHLARHLRWDAEEDLARVLGDAAAHRVTGLARGVADWHRDAARRLSQALMEYAQGEARVLAPRAGYQALAADVARLRDAIERLEKRIERLE